MKCIAFFAALFLVHSGMLARDHPSAVGHGQADGKSFYFPVTMAEVVATPAWGADAPHPPLSARDAIAIARRQLDELVTDRAVWRFDQVCLSEFGADRWAYFVGFRREYPPEIAVIGADTFYIPVLMNGATIKPEVTHVEPNKTGRSK